MEVSPSHRLGKDAPLSFQPVWIGDRRPPKEHCQNCGLVLCDLDGVGSRYCWICVKGELQLRIYPRQIGLIVEAALTAGLKGKARRVYLLTQLKRRPCARCDQTFPPPAMDFHHIRRESKVGRVEGLPMNEMATELTKCLVLCACCHRIEEAARGQKQAQFVKSLR